LVTFFVVPRPPEAQRRVNQEIGEGQKRIDLQRSDIRAALKKTDRDLWQFDHNLSNRFVIGSRSTRNTAQILRREQIQPKERARQRDELVKTWRELNDKLIKLNQDFVTLEKAGLSARSR